MFVMCTQIINDIRYTNIWSIDIAKFTQSMLQNGQNMTQLLSKSYSKSTPNLHKLKEKRIFEDPPFLKDNANYQVYIHWVHQILNHL